MSRDRIRKDVGKRGEDVACEFLARKGYRVIGRNYRRKWGEVDVIAEKDGTVRFVEVKAISLPSQDFSREMVREPEELVHHTKLAKIARTAALYMQENKDEREYQIDVVGVIMDNARRIARCRLFEQAIGGDL